VAVYCATGDSSRHLLVEDDGPETETTTITVHDEGTATVTEMTEHGTPAAFSPYTQEEST